MMNDVMCTPFNLKPGIRRYVGGRRSADQKDSFWADDDFLESAVLVSTRQDVPQCCCPAAEPLKLQN